MTAEAIEKKVKLIILSLAMLVIIFIFINGRFAPVVGAGVTVEQLV